MWLLWCYMVKDVFLLNESLFTLILGANVWNSFDWGINGWVIANKRWLDRIRMFGAEHVDLSKGLFFPHSENVSPFSFLHKKSTPTMRSWSPTPFWNFPLSSCVGFVFVWEKNQGKVAFTCLNPVGFLEWLNWAILGWVCSLKVSSLLSKDSRQYSYSHQKQGESQKPSFSSIVPHVLYIYIPFFFVRKIFPVTKWWGGNIHRDAWGFLGQLGFSSLNLELALWQDRFFAENMNIQYRPHRIQL